MKAAVSVVERFRLGLAAGGGPAAGDRVVVAVSGGLDSCVLLHLARFHAPVALELVAAHYDHALRAESADDALWVRGLCAAWGVPLRTARAGERPRSEEGARALRYAFLERVREEERARFVLVGHHADDQAETVLFRVLRGTGIGGLAAIPRARAPAVLRPLLDVWRAELEAYAAARHLAWREDATNDELGYARNAIRHRILPDAERLVAPGARRALVRLARLAEENEAAWEARVAPLLETIAQEDGDEIRVDRDALAGVGPALAARVLRRLAARLGGRLDEAATRRALAFLEAGRSGSGVDLGGGLRLRRSLDRLVLGPSAHREGEDRPLRIPDPGPGRGRAVLAGAQIEVVWGSAEADERAHATCLRVGPGDFPLHVRARAAGDRISLAGGRRKLKKVLLEARIPLDRRGRVPVVVDAAGEVLWVPGVARAVRAEEERERRTTMRIGVG